MQDFENQILSVGSDLSKTRILPWSRHFTQDGKFSVLLVLKGITVTVCFSEDSIQIVSFLAKTFPTIKPTLQPGKVTE
jgi:hypothetical protein